MHRVIISFITTILIAPSLVSAQIPKPEDTKFLPLMFKSNRGGIFSAAIGRLSVPENRSGPSGNRIELPVLKLKARGKNPGFPIIYLADGPGGSATDEGFVLEPSFYKLLEHHDIILTDQRGTGRSRPLVFWEAPTSLPPDYFLSYETMREHDRWLSEQAVPYFRNQNIDLAGYNSVESADDLNDLRLVLGADKLILIGAGYGAHLAMATVRRHPEIVQSVVLIGAQGPDHILKLPSAYDALFKELSDLAAQDPAVRTAIPDMVALLRRILNRLDSRPITISIRDTKTRQTVNAQVGRFGLLRILALEMRGRNHFREFPALLSAVDKGEYTLLKKFVEKWYNQLGQGVSGMQVMMNLYASATPQRLSRINRESGASLFGNAVNYPYLDIGDAWGRPNLGNSYRASVESDIRALFISGTLDSVAPPAEMEEIRKGFSRSVHCIVRYAGHDNIVTNPQVQQLIVDFLAGKIVQNERIALEKPKFTPTK